MREVRRLKKYIARLDKKTRGRIKTVIIICLILIIVSCFVALVVGLSLGLKSTAACGSGLSPCGSPQVCYNLQYSDDNCGKCGYECVSDATCVKGKCVFCQFNCSEDSDPCTDEPCNSTTGCTMVCPVLLLDSPFTNLSNSVSDLTQSPQFVSNTKLTLTSASNIQNATVTVSPHSSTGVILFDAPSVNLAASYNNNTGVLTVATIASASNYTTFLKTLKYKNTGAIPATTFTFTFSVTNTNSPPRSLVSPVVGTLIYVPAG